MLYIFCCASLFILYYAYCYTCIYMRACNAWMAIYLVCMYNLVFYVVLPSFVGWAHISIPACTQGGAQLPGWPVQPVQPDNHVRWSHNTRAQAPRPTRRGPNTRSPSNTWFRCRDPGSHQRVGRGGDGSRGGGAAWPSAGSSILGTL